MKHKYLPLLLSIGLCSCNSDSLVDSPDDLITGMDDTQTISFEINSSGDKGSRGGRLLTSSEATDDVDIVTLAIYRLGSDGALGQKVFERSLSWKDSVATLSEGQAVHINLRKSPELAPTNGLTDGFYTMVATGYSTDRSFSFTYNAGDLNAGYPIPLALFPAGTDAEEIFAGGISSIEVKDGQFVPDANMPTFKTVTLRRQVAGTFGYFTSVPTKGFNGMDATHLRLVASVENNLLCLGAFNQSGEIENVVNGTVSGTIRSNAEFVSGAEGYTVYETALADWFPKGDINGDGVLNEKDANYNGMSGNWKVPAYLDGKISVKMGTIFCSNFVIPFLNNGKPTFELQLITKNRDGSIYILRHWSVSSSYKQSGVKYVSRDGSVKDAETTETSISYSVLRNYIYSIGKKAIANPDSDSYNGDEPENLSKGEIVVISVNDNWEGHDRLVIKPQV